MLSLNTKSRYGLAAVLTLAAHYDKGLLKIKEVADRNSIPPKYLEQIFSRLGQAEIIKSVRGKNGGYMLNLAPDRITALAVIDAMEGGIGLATSDGSGPEAVRQLLQEAEQRLKEALSVSLAELLTRQQKFNQTIVYHI